MTQSDVFGRVLDPGRVEAAVKATLKTWLPDHLANQERENNRPAGSLPQPRSWPTMSKYETLKHDQLPSIVVISPGTGSEPTKHGNGRTDAVFRIEVAAVVHARDEQTARDLASMYVAAIVSALTQNGSLGGLAVATRWSAYDLTYGTTVRGAQDAIYAALFDIDVPNVVNTRRGPVEPTAAPHDPPANPVTFTDADITVNSEDLIP